MNVGDRRVVEVQTGTYKGCSSLTIENEQLKVELVPQLGGKLVSMIYKPTGKQWLLDSGTRPLEQPAFGSTFTDWDMSGWDECFPTIIACPSGVDEHILLPDHGELWSLPGTCKVEEGTVDCTIASPQLPYRFSRRLSLVDADRVRLAYRAENDGDKPIPFLWVPHPQFAITERTRLLLPDAMERMLCVFGGKKLALGNSYSWKDVSQLSPNVTGDARKFYYEGKVTTGWSGLYEEESSNYFIMSVSTDKVPYIGIWIDEGMINDRVTCALEPSIGYYDSLEKAISNGTAQVIPAKGSFEWEIELSLGVGDWSKAVQP
jgi:galactose mutarotase-like enzyme